MPRSTLLFSTLSLALLAAMGASCEVKRTVEREGGMHPPAFADVEHQDDPDFHRNYLHREYEKYNTYPLATCRRCHGEDYNGGDSGTSCNTGGCHDHAPGVEWCGTCHDNHAPPEPTSGSHHAHAQGCQNCHHVPTSAREVKHPDGHIEVTLSGLAAKGGLPAQWNAEERRCDNTYCHGNQSPVWESPPAPLPCNTCHESPPANHARFVASIGEAPDGCALCHPAHDDPRHLDGKIEILEMGCNTCHGSSPDGAPPKGLDGATQASSPSVGAHQRHLDPTLADRMGKPVDCDTCHEVPATVLATGHMDTSAPADVRIWGAMYNPENQTCVVSCHWNKDPGPSWNDTSGAPRQCDGCHGFPPAKTREGVPHPQVEEQQIDEKIAKCRTCHQFEPATHVDGHMDFLP